MDTEWRKAQEEALEWLDRMRSGAFTGAEHGDFVTWVRSSPQNARAIFEARALEGEIAEVLHDQPFELEDLSGKLVSRFWTAKRIPSMTAGVIVAVVAAGLLLWGSSHTASWSTGPGEWKSISLRDGSLVRIGPNTDLSASFNDSRRLISLSRGAAMFKVAHDRDVEFIVDAGISTTRDVGTAFAVERLTPTDVVITVDEGIVAIRGANRTSDKDEVVVSAGNQARVKRDGPIVVANVDVRSALAWVDKKIVFDDVRLADAVATLNRLTDKTFVLADTAIADVQISGIFPASSSDAFTDYIRGRGIGVVCTNPTTILLRRSNLLLEDRSR